MRIIELCAGYGGLGLGVQIAVPSARVVCAVERQAYTVARWRELVEAEAMESVAIWPDVESFAWAMAERNRKRLGLQLPECDMLTAGFPCQPFSQAGKRRGIEDHRWIWPAIRRTIGILRPRYCLLENVPGILNAGGFGRVLGDLAALGFDAEWDCIPAADAGANHFRFRVFILAWRHDADAAGESQREPKHAERSKSRNNARTNTGRCSSRSDAEHPLCERCGGQPKHQGEQAAGGGLVAPADATDATRGGLASGRESSGSDGLTPSSGSDDGHTHDMVSHWQENARCSRVGDGSPEAPRDDGHAEHGRRKRRGAERQGASATMPPSPRDDGHATGERPEERDGLRPRRQTADTATAPPEWRDAGPAPGGVDDGAPSELDQGWWSDCPYPPEQWLSRDEPDRAEQLSALGNGVIPLQAALALTLLARRAGVTL